MARYLPIHGDACTMGEMVGRARARSEPANPHPNRRKGTPMNLIPCHTGMAPELASLYNVAIRDLPHCYPVSPEEFAITLSPTSEIDRNAARLEEQVVLAAREGTTLIGLIHLGRARPNEQGQPGPGVLRFFWYARGHRQTGVDLLAAADEQFQRWGARRVQAFHYDYHYPFYHVQHVHLSAYLDHVQALLGMAEYHPGGSQINLDWPNFEPVTPAPTTVPVEIALEWEAGRGIRPNLAVHAHQGDKEVGLCVCLSLGERSSAPEAQDWVYTVWLGVDEGSRVQGLGRHLLQRALQEMYGIGYRHATICTIGDNYRAYLLYSNNGYRAVDWTYTWERELR